jgi:hypothetical protein
VDRRRADASLGAQHQRRLAGESRERRLALSALGDMARQRRLANAGVAEQAKDLGIAPAQPMPHLIERGGLLARPAWRGAGRRFRAGRRLGCRGGGRFLQTFEIDLGSAFGTDHGALSQVIEFGAAGLALALRAKLVRRCLLRHESRLGHRMDFLNLIRAVAGRMLPSRDVQN